MVFRAEGEALVTDDRVGDFDGVRVLAQPYVGGCAIMVRRAVLDKLGPVPCRGEAAAGNGNPAAPLLDSGWTFYQERINELGLVNGYPWPPIHVDHMEDVRSPRTIRTAEYEAYKQDMRGMGLEQFTQELCVWRPIWEGNAGKGDRLQVTGDSRQEAGGGEDGNAGKGEEGKRGGGENAKASDFNSQDQSSKTQAPVPTNDNGRMTQDKKRMCFRHDFVTDFDQFDFSGPAFAFVRYGDGERAICMGKPIDGTDGWRYAGGQSAFQEALLAALRFNDRDYYVGISDSCCDAASHEWYLRQITVPPSQVTFANIFANGNYQRFRRLDLGAATTVAPEGAITGCPPIS
jgi:hypothetical protein